MAAAGGVTATSTAGGAFLQQPQGNAGAGSYKITVPDNQPLLLSVPNGTLSLSRDLSRAGSITLQATEVQVTDTIITSQGTVTINATKLMVTSGSEATTIGGNSGTVLNIGSGGVTIRGGNLGLDGPSGTSATLGTSGMCTGTIAGDLIITGGSAAGASAQLVGAPDIGSAASPLRIGGQVIMTTGTGEGAFARVAADRPETIYLNFPNLSSGGYTVDGQPAVFGGTSGFYAGGVPAILGRNLIVTYGGPETPSSPDGVLTSYYRGSVFTFELDDMWRRRQQQDVGGLPACR